MKQPPDFLQWEEKKESRDVEALLAPELKLDHGGLYRHDKTPKSYYLSRTICVQAMCKVGASKLYSSFSGDWVALPLTCYEKENLRKTKMLRWNKNVSF